MKTETLSPLTLGALDAEGSRQAYIADDAAVSNIAYDDGTTLFIGAGGQVVFAEMG